MIAIYKKNEVLHMLKATDKTNEKGMNAHATYCICNQETSTWTTQSKTGFRYCREGKYGGLGAGRRSLYCGSRAWLVK